MDARDPQLAHLVERVLAAEAGGESLDIRGGGTKAFYGGAPQGEPLQVGELAGISSYEPTELVATARAGTPLAGIPRAIPCRPDQKMGSSDQGDRHSIGMNQKIEFGEPSRVCRRHSCWEHQWPCKSRT